jgi:hypothetical protein
MIVYGRSLGANSSCVAGFAKKNYVIFWGYSRKSLWGKGSARAVAADCTWVDGYFGYRLSIATSSYVSFVRQRYIYVANADYESTEGLLRSFMNHEVYFGIVANVCSQRTAPNAQEHSHQG